MERKCKIITIVLFMVILCGVGLLIAFNSGKKYSVLEKRELAKFPKTNAKTIINGKFRKGFNKFLSDHVVFRDQCIYVTTVVDKLMGRAEKGDVYFGKDGYLIEKGEKIEPNRVKENIEYLSSYVNMLADGIGSENVKVFMIPNKEYVITDKLPKFVELPTDNTNMKAMLWNSLKDKKMLVDLTKGLQKHKDEYIYYKTDHHWTSLGAKYGYEIMMDELGEKKLQGEKPKVIADDFQGTTFNRIHYAPQKDLITKYNIKTAEEASVEREQYPEITDIYYEKALKTEDKYEYFMGGNYGVTKIHTGCTNGKTLALIKDSFANCIVPFLTSNYENIVMIDPRYLLDTLTNTLSDVGNIDSVIVLFNEEKFMTNTDLTRVFK